MRLQSAQRRHRHRRRLRRRLKEASAGTEFRLASEVSAFSKISRRKQFRRDFLWDQARAEVAAYLLTLGYCTNGT
jgi:hypothetical protein